MTDIAEKIRSYTNWLQNLNIGGIDTLDPEAKSTPHHINRTRIRRKLFLEPMIRSRYLEDKEVLDLGCSYGYWAMATASEGNPRHVQGVDALSSSIEQGNWIMEVQGITGCTLEVADAYEYLRAAASDSYDVVLCLGFFYHIRDPHLLLSEMLRVTRGIVVIDTMVHKSEEALLSARPVSPKPLIEQSILQLELFSSPKAIYWMALEAGYKEIVSLTTDLGGDPHGTWDYRNGQRATFALSKGPALKEIFDNAVDMPYLTPAQDFEKYGLYPEMHGRTRTESDTDQKAGKTEQKAGDKNQKTGDTDRKASDMAAEGLRLIVAALRKKISGAKNPSP